VLDAFREEPLPADSELYSTPNIIVTPHTSWSSGRVLDRSIQLFLREPWSLPARRATDNLVDPNAATSRAGSDRRARPAGKTTVFNTMTRGEAETAVFGGMTVNVGVVKVPDERSRS
jgi:hypothetical protein